MPVPPPVQQTFGQVHGPVVVHWAQSLALQGGPLQTVPVFPGGQHMYGAGGWDEPASVQ
jgi:hypothetical protein